MYCVVFLSTCKKSLDLEQIFDNYSTCSSATERWVPVKCETKSNRNKTKLIETAETNQNKTKPNERKSKFVTKRTKRT